MRNRVEVLHGVNLDVLGRRDPEHYGGMSLPELEVKIKRFAHDLELEVTFFQSNLEGEFVEYLHRLPELADAAIINAGRVDPLQLRDPRRARDRGVPGGRGSPLRRRVPRGVAAPLRVRGAGDRGRVREGRRRATARRSRC